jgi:hypothetical protein
MRSFVKAADAQANDASGTILGRLSFLRRQLIDDLKSGDKVFVFRDMFKNLTDQQIERLHSAVRRYGPGTLLYVRYSDEIHPAGSVEQAAPGLLIGYMSNFSNSIDNRYIGSCDDAWLAVCRRAWQICASVGEEDRPDAVVPAPEGKRPLAGTPRARRIVLIGNCQMQAMMQLYQRFVAGRTGDRLRHVPSYADLTDDGRKAIEEADVVVEQLLDLKPKADTDGLSTATARLYIPMVTAAFLWPFAGQPHPKNAACPFLTGGPYGGEASDSYLNRLILSGTDPEEAVETYVNLDVRKRVNLDRLFELVMDRQRSRDEATGYDIAGVIEGHFRTEQIFLSPYHPNTRVSIALATRFFEQLGADRADIERMRAQTNITPFPKGELPVHPAVARHFGLTYVTPDRRYRFMNEGLFTFREYALRYMRYEWNDALEEGMSLTHNRDYGPAMARLRQGLERSPGRHGSSRRMPPTSRTWVTWSGIAGIWRMPKRRCAPLLPLTGSIRIITYCLPTCSGSAESSTKLPRPSAMRSSSTRIPPLCAWTLRTLWTPRATGPRQWPRWKRHFYWSPVTQGCTSASHSCSCVRTGPPKPSTRRKRRSISTRNRAPTG